MTVEFTPVDNRMAIIAAFTGALDQVRFETSLAPLQEKLDAGHCLLVDFSGAAIAMSAADFMSAIDHWFGTLGPRSCIALVFDPIAQNEQAMLFDTKGFLVGASLKTFTARQSALDWLADQRTGQPG